MVRKIAVFGFNNRGYDGQVVGIECDIRTGFPSFEVTGLCDSVVKESRERVRTAMHNSGFKFPQCKVLVNLSPSGLHKGGSLLDLGIALSILFAGRQSNQHDDKTEYVKIMVAGELMLDGSVLEDASALGAVSASEKAGCNLCLVPFNVDDLGYESVVQAKNLTQAFLACGELLNNIKTLEKNQSALQGSKTIFSDIIGLNKEKEIVSMAASGFHSLLLFGPPGVGKTMLCGRIASLMPDLDVKQQETVIRIWGCAGIQNDNPQKPVSRIVSHDCSAPQFTGGVGSLTPGEGALAYGGILILDEMTKYSPNLLLSVKDAYDKGFTQSSRSGQLVTYPSVYMMVGNLNPCPCSNLGVPDGVCTCSAQKIENHWNKIGRPLLERFDIRLPVKMQNDIFAMLNESSRPDSYYTDKICLARERQKFRYKNIDNVFCNGHVHLNGAATNLLRKEIEMFGKFNNCKQSLSGVGAISMVCLVRTIADYNDRDNVTEEDFEKAKKLRQYGNGDYYWRTMD